MFELAGPPLFVFVPFIAFSIIFLFILLVKLCMVVSHGGDWRSLTGRPSRSRLGQLRANGPSSTTSTTSVDHLASVPSPITRPPSPPSYYAGMASPGMFYPMYVPPFIATNNGLESYRDPRHFQGLAGIQAPPPYPPPPSYSQIASIPELPHVSAPRLGTSGGGAAKSMDDFPPVND